MLAKKPAAVPATPGVVLGTYVDGRRQRPLELRGRELNVHQHVAGLSGMGKSLFIASQAVQYLRAGRTVFLLDPHTDLARTVLGLLLDTGFYTDPRAFTKVWYINWAQSERVIPFNVIADDQGYDEYQLASNVYEAFSRKWSALGHGQAPLLEAILLNSVPVLVRNRLPLTELLPMLLNADYRNRLLTKVADERIRSFFTDRFSVWGKGQMIESLARRLDIASFHPTLRRSLGATENLLSHRRLLAEGTTVLHDLGGLDSETLLTLGCLLLVDIEQAAASRALLPLQQRSPGHVLVDEYSLFAATSAESMERILFLARKFNVFLTIANQSTSQLSREMQGALDNVGIQVAFRLSPNDARREAPRFTVYDPRSGESLAQQRQNTELLLQSLPPQRAVVHLGDRTIPITTVSVDGPEGRERELDALIAEYGRRLFAGVGPSRQPSASEVAPASSAKPPAGEPRRVQYFEDF